MDKYGQIPEFWKLLNSPEVDGFIGEFNYILLDCEKYDERDIEEITKTSSNVVGFPVNARLLKKVENNTNEKSKNYESELNWD